MNNPGKKYYLLQNNSESLGVNVADTQAVTAINNDKERRDAIVTGKKNKTPPDRKKNVSNKKKGKPKTPKSGNNSSQRLKEKPNECQKELSSSNDR